MQSIHTGLKPFSCICGETFKWAGKRDVHRKTCKIALLKMLRIPLLEDLSSNESSALKGEVSSAESSAIKGDQDQVSKLEDNTVIGDEIDS